MIITACVKRCLLIFVMVPLFTAGQVYDDFSDGDITHDPPWQGNTDSFKVNASFQLQLDEEEAGSAYLYTSLDISPEMEWRLWVKQSFSPSANNHSRIYLLAGSQGGEDPPDGIFLLLGESGSNDAITLMEQTNGDTTTLLRGSPGAIASSFSCRIRVLFSDGYWQLMADYTENDIYTPEGTVAGELPAGESHLGIYCKYTSSNSKKFYFDDIYAGPMQHDTLPPEANRVIVKSPFGLEVQFSESLDEVTAANPANFTVSQGVGQPASSALLASDASTAGLFFNDSLPYGILLNLEIKNIKDLAGNMMEPAILDFAWYEAKPHDVVINEIMADPSPPQYLPDHEYLELFNPTGLPLDLSGWTLLLGTSEKIITEAFIGAGGFLILGKEDAAQSLEIFGNFYGFQSFSLVNGGQSIILSNKDGMMISGLYYTDKWYRDADKASGGWSLEQINPYNPCLNSDNWKASENKNGGTPGKENSVFDDTGIDPEIVSACVIDSVRIYIGFNQSMHPDLSMSPHIFYIDQGIGAPVAILPGDAFLTTFILYPEIPLSPGTVYELSVMEDIVNCLGEPVRLNGIVRLGLPRKPAWQDIVINEILFDPYTGGNDYVEIYNRSGHAVNINGLMIGSVKNNPPLPADTSLVILPGSCHALLPGEYALLCSSFDKVVKFYPGPAVKNHLETGSFPAYGNESGTVVLFDEDLVPIDEFTYHENMHYPFLNTSKGVSLERIHYDRPAQDATNWHSASQSSGFGTPGYRNSMFMEPGENDGSVSVQPRVFTPGIGGINNCINIHYRLDDAGNLARIMIFDVSGRLIRTLVNNELLGSSGSYSWDGLGDDRQKAAAGIYIILVELTDIRGRVKRYKETAVVAPLR